MKRKFIANSSIIYSENGEQIIKFYSNGNRDINRNMSEFLIMMIDKGMINFNMIKNIVNQKYNIDFNEIIGVKR